MPNEAGARDDTSFTTKVISEALSHLDPQTRLQAALLAFFESHMYPRRLVKTKEEVPTMVPKYSFLEKPGWHMVHGSTAIPLEENWEDSKHLPKKTSLILTSKHSKKCMSRMKKVRKFLST